MKRFLAILFTTILALIISSNLDNFVYAESQYYPEACALYSVDYINDDGSFENIACFNDFNSAKAKMQENDDYVVRHAQAYSATKIVAMNSGLVYSFPRGSSSTMSIYSDYNDKNKTTTYVTARYEMTYIDTPYMSAKSGFEGQGYTKVIMNGFVGYADTEYLDFVPSKYIDNNIPIYLGGSYSNNSISAMAVKIIPNYYTIKKNGNYYDLEFHYHLSYPDSNGNAYEATIIVDNGENYSFMEVGEKYYSDDGINFYRDYYKENKVGTAYNYYQYLSLRSKSNISASTLDAYLKSKRSDYSSSVIKGKGSVFVELGDEYGCNSTLIYAMACLESSYGTSGYAVNRNNLFGWNAFDDSPDDASYFSSVDVAIKEQMGRNLRRFMDYADSRYNGTYVGSKGSGFNLKYAGDPYWGMKISAIYYSIDKYANGNNGKLSDHNQYTLGLISTDGAKIYYDQACNKAICTSYYYGKRQVNNIVVLKEKIGNVYKIQFSNPISSGEVVTDTDGVYGYSWSQSIAYIKASDVEVLFNKTVANGDLNHDSIVYINSASLKGSSLTINGIGAISNLDFTNLSQISHTISLVDMTDETKTYTYDGGKIDTNGFSMNDGFDYKYSGFEVVIDLSKVDLGSYIVYITTQCGDYRKTTSLKTTDNDLRCLVSEDESYKYRFSANLIYSYRVELDILNTTIDFASINKPSKRDSLIEYFTPIFNESDNTISFSGFAMIYYLNYANSNDDRYDLYLVDNGSGKTIKFDLENVEIDENIKQQINSIYDITYTSFKGTINLNELDTGDYTLMLGILTSDNGISYIDYLEFVAEGRTMPSFFDGTYNYEFYVSDVRNRLMLKVSEA